MKRPLGRFSARLLMHPPGAVGSQACHTIIAVQPAQVNVHHRWAATEVPMAHSLIGVSLKRVEDATLLRGAGRYLDDHREPGLLHLAFVRSPHPHARVRGIDGSAALALPGVVALLTLADL